MKTQLLSLLLLTVFSLGVSAQTNADTVTEQCGSMLYLQELMKKDPTLKARMDSIEVTMQHWIKNNDMSRIKNIKPPHVSAKDLKPGYPSTQSLCGYDNTLVATIAAPTTVGQVVSPNPNCVNGGQAVRVTGLMSGNIYRISTCGTNTFDTQLSIYTPDWGGVAVAHNDDYCSGAQSEIYFNPRTSGDHDILVDAFNCASNTLCASLEVELIKKPRPVITVPVVFHIIHKGEPVGGGTNVSDAIINGALLTLNQDFRRLNAGINSTQAAFRGVSDDMLIQFCMATKDPSGNPTTGITRMQGNGGSPAYSMSTFEAIKPTTIWDNKKYLNIWVCHLGNINGYSSFPGEPDNLDGVVIRYTAFGFGMHMAETHEVGHYFNLRHIWGDDNGACTGEDSVTDTPKQGAFTPNSGCPTFPVLDGCSPKYPGIMFNNFMDYAGNACVSMFTIGQGARVDATMATYRIGLQTSNGCGNSTTPVNDIDLSNSFSVFPNPSIGSFSFSTKEKYEKINLSVVNVLGEKIFETNTSEKETTIELKDQPNGVYFMKISLPTGEMDSNPGTVIKKLVINK